VCRRPRRRPPARLLRPPRGPQAHGLTRGRQLGGGCGAGRLGCVSVARCLAGLCSLACALEDGDSTPGSCQALSGRRQPRCVYAFEQLVAPLCGTPTRNAACHAHPPPSWRRQPAWLASIPSWQTLAGGGAAASASLQLPHRCEQHACLRLPAAAWLLSAALASTRGRQPRMTRQGVAHFAHDLPSFRLLLLLAPHPTATAMSPFQSHEVYLS
jgi:hypothetical protein